jgi:hypothetical protein
MQGYNVALSQVRYVLVLQLLLQMDIIYLYSLQAVQLFKEYLLNALFSRCMCVLSNYNKYSQD